MEHHSASDISRRRIGAAGTGSAMRIARHDGDTAVHTLNGR